MNPDEIVERGRRVMRLERDAFADSKDASARSSQTPCGSSPNRRGA